MRRVLSSLVLVLVTFLITTACSVPSDRNDTEKQYDGFVKQARAIHEKAFNPTGFEYLNTSIDPVTYIAYWESQFEPKTSDQFQGQEQTPTRFEYNYLSEDGTVLIVLRFVFIPWEQPKRLVYLSTLASGKSGIPGGTSFPYPLQQEAMYSFDHGYMTATGFLVKVPDGVASETDKLQHLVATFYPFQQALDTYIGKLDIGS